MGPHPAVAAIRLAVRRALAGLARRRPRAGRLLGRRRLAGPGRRAGLRGPAARAATRAGSPSITGCRRDRRSRPAGSRRPGRAGPRPGARGPRRGRPARRARPYPGPEAAARAARYAALDQAAAAAARPPILLGHTLDDQAETVLLGLARGSGARVAGRDGRRVSGRYLRPLLGVRRAQTRAACAALGAGRLGGPAQQRSRLRPGRGSARRCCPRWRSSSGRAWPRRWPGPRASCAPTPTSSTSWPPRPPRSWPTVSRGLPAGRAGGAAAPPSGPGCSGPPRWRPAPRRAPCDQHVTAAGRAGHRLARAARRRPARRHPLPAAVWQADLRGGGPVAGPRTCAARGDRRAEWTRLTWEPTSRRS